MTDKRKYAYFVVEGQHDVALVMRVPVPTFYRSDMLSVAIHVANSDSQLITMLNGSLANMEMGLLQAVAVFCDADTKTAEQRKNSLLRKINKDFEEIGLRNRFVSMQAGKVSKGTPNLGLYVFPNNQDTGTLENVLLSCAAISYPHLLDKAQQYVEAVDEDYKKKWKGSERQKVVVGCVANVLKPGKANQVSIQDNDWICQETIEKVREVALLQGFIKNLLQ